MFVRYPPGRIRYEGDRPVALLGVRAPQGELDRQAARAIQHLLTGDRADRGGRRLRTRTWRLPARASWISGQYNDHGHSPSAPGPLRPAAPHRPRDAGPQHAGDVAVGTRPGPRGS